MNDNTTKKDKLQELLDKYEQELNEVKSKEEIIEEEQIKESDNK